MKSTQNNTIELAEYDNLVDDITAKTNHLTTLMGYVDSITEDMENVELNSYVKERIGQLQDATAFLHDELAEINTVLDKAVERSNQEIREERKQ